MLTPDAQYKETLATSILRLSYQWNVGGHCLYPISKLLVLVLCQLVLKLWSDNWLGILVVVS